MKILFTHGNIDNTKYVANHKRMVTQLKRMRHLVELENDNIVDNPDFRKLLDAIKKQIQGADVVMAEVSEFTPELAYKISFALANEIPVIAYCIYDDYANVSPVLLGNTHPLYTFRKYNADSIEETIKSDMLYVANLANNQFTFIISPGIKSYLDWNYKHRKISRGLLIRLLIEEKMQNDKEYRLKHS